VFRDAVCWAIGVALIVGIGIGTAWRPFMQMLEEATEDLAFCEDDLARATGGTALASKRTAERDRAVAYSDQWRRWYEEAHRDRTALAGSLSSARSEIHGLNLVRSGQAQEIVELKAAKTKVVKAAAAPLPKRKPRLKKRKPVRVVYRWVLF